MQIVLDNVRTCSCSQQSHQPHHQSRVANTFAQKRVSAFSITKRLRRLPNVYAAASSLEGPGVYTRNSSLLGPSLDLGPSSQSTAAAVNLDEIPLESDAGVDYIALRDALKEGDFQRADDETRANLIELAGDAAVKRGWVYFSEVKFISAKDLSTLDLLWKSASNGKFGYSVQREIWIQNRKMWPKFFKAIDWTVGANSNYRKWPKEFKYNVEAPRGHLPLTNALRGTRLFEAIMEHPAFANKSQENKPDWLK